jgi:hypothetical protein
MSAPVPIHTRGAAFPYTSTRKFVAAERPSGEESSKWKQLVSRSSCHCRGGSKALSHFQKVLGPVADACSFTANRTYCSPLPVTAASAARYFPMSLIPHMSSLFDEAVARSVAVTMIRFIQATLGTPGIVRTAAYASLSAKSSWPQT